MNFKRFMLGAGAGVLTVGLTAAGAAAAGPSAGLGRRRDADGHRDQRPRRAGAAAEGGYARVLQVDVGDDGTAEFEFDRSTFDRIQAGGAGRDQIRSTRSTALADEATTLDGGSATTCCSAATATSRCGAARAVTASMATAAPTRPTWAAGTTASPGTRATAATSSRAGAGATRSCSTGPTSTRASREATGRVRVHLQRRQHPHGHWRGGDPGPQHARRVRQLLRRRLPVQHGDEPRRRRHVGRRWWPRRPDRQCEPRRTYNVDHITADVRRGGIVEKCRRPGGDASPGAPSPTSSSSPPRASATPSMSTRPSTP